MVTVWAQQARQAYDLAIHYLTQNTLPSDWTDEGRGWQEVWQSATRAGFYASCDGILILDSFAKHSGNATVHELVSQVYNEHLCKVMDTRSPKVNTLDPHQRRVREECLSTTMYVAKFLQASYTSVVRGVKKKNKLADALVSILLRSSKERHGMWACTIRSDDPKPALCATVEALTALSMSGSAPLHTFRKGLNYLLEIAESKTDLRRSRVALWGISELLAYADGETIKAAVNVAEQQWEIDQSRDEELDIEKFWNKVTNNNGYYSYNAKLLFLKATINLIRQGHLHNFYLRYVLPATSQLTDRIIENRGFYSGAGKPVQFWEHYQAMDVLRAFLDVINEEQELREDKYVLVKPIHFHKHSFRMDKTLAVVLMPFMKPWSTDLYRVFEQTVSSKGFSCWRSDKEYKDDAIIQTVWDRINRAAFVIADCTDRNPNVFYELGIAHTVGRPVFLCAQNRKDFPFDISSIRSHAYGTLPNQIKDLKRQLGSFIDSLRPGETTE